MLAERQTAGGRALAWILRLWILLAFGIVLADMADSAKIPWSPPGRSIPPPDRLGKEGPAVPMPLPPAGPGDQLRPYDPTIFPMRPDGGTPQLPGGGALEPSYGPMKFSWIDLEGRPAILAVGTIEPGAAAALRRFDLQHDERAEVLVLFSPGGAVQEALIMGEYIRARSIETLVPGGAYCASACPLLLAAGERRRVARDAWIGLHQPYFAKAAGLSPDVAVAEVQRLNYQILTRLDRWGVDPRVWTHALQALPAEMYVLLPEELMAYRMAHSLF
ncbi:MAG: hypothetical protein GDA41_12515 [Rhodospirillales bacterium]|nr:hypothetical protein [Rhodospirillales bacterium]